MAGGESYSTKSNSLDLLKDMEEKINEMIEEVKVIGRQTGGEELLKEASKY